MSDSSNIASKCPNCKKGVYIRPDQVNKRLRCPSCKYTFTHFDYFNSDTPVNKNSPVSESHENKHQFANDAFEIAILPPPIKVWPIAKIEKEYRNSPELVYRAVLQTLKTSLCTIEGTDKTNYIINFSLNIHGDTYHEVRILECNSERCDMTICSKQPNIDFRFDKYYTGITNEIDKYLKFSFEPTNRILKSEDENDYGFRCPYCRSKSYPLHRSKISSGGWVVFALMLLFCLPLCFIGLLITDSYRECSRCGMRIGG